MHIKLLLTIAVTALSVSAAVAQEYNPGIWSKFSDVTLPASRSRSEVLAELEIYRRSGLADLNWRGDSLDVNSNEYRLAAARYAAMRAAPEFIALVKSIAQRRGEAVDLATVRPAR